MAYYDSLTFNSENYLAADERDYFTDTKLHDLEASEDPFLAVDDLEEPVDLWGVLE